MFFEFILCFSVVHFLVDKMESIKIFDCVKNDDVEGLKLLIDYPDYFGDNNILHRAIYAERIAVFDFLLSLERCPINARNNEGKTSLQLALCYRPEHFAYSLIKQGADINCNFDEETSLLHHALRMNYTKVAKLLIEQGADLNCCDFLGQTPLHIIVYELPERNEFLAMTLCFGADLTIPDDENYKPIDFAFKKGYVSESEREHLVLYFFDDNLMDYEIPVDCLFDLLQSDSPLAPQVVKHITSVNLDNTYSLLDTYFLKLFIIKPKYLKLLLEKFAYVIQNIIDDSLANDTIHNYYAFSKEMIVENFDLLLQSKFSSDLIQIINKIKIFEIILKSQHLEKAKLFERIMILLSYGADVCDEDLEILYQFFGDCKFFRTLLHMDIKIWADEDARNIMPALLYDIHVMDIETFLSDPHKYVCSVQALKQLLNYFAHPKLKNFYYYYLPVENEDYRAKVEDLPSVPLLVELARNELRKFLIRKYKITNSSQFYTLIKHLPISKVYKKIITLETKLY